MTEWISVTDDVPNDSDFVLIATRSGCVGEGYLEDGTWWWISGVKAYVGVTHWMPLPSPPGEEGSNE